MSEEKEWGDIVRINHDVPAIQWAAAELVRLCGIEARFVPDPDDACGKCGGIGRRSYGSTATWRGGIGGQVITEDVCDVCWGSGRKLQKGADLRVMYNELSRLRLLEAKAKKINDDLLAEKG